MGPDMNFWVSLNADENLYCSIYVILVFYIFVFIAIHMFNEIPFRLN